MVEMLVVGAGGFLGAIARFGLSSVVQRAFSGAFPAATLLVNVLGCFTIGALMTLVHDRPDVSPHVRLFLTIGLLGSFTTFSTLGLETFQMLEARDLAGAFRNVAANAVVGVAAVGVGRFAVRAFAG